MNTRTLKAYGKLHTSFGDYMVFKKFMGKDIFIASPCDGDEWLVSEDGKDFILQQPTTVYVSCDYVFSEFLDPKEFVVKWEREVTYREVTLNNLAKIWEGDYAE